MELKDRVKAARKYANLTQGELVQRVKDLPSVESFSQQALTKLETGRSKKSAYLTHIAHVCGVDPFWLATGKGKMVDQIHMTADLEPPPDYAIAKNKEEEALIDKYRDLSPEVRSRLQEIMNALEIVERKKKTK